MGLLTLLRKQRQKEREIRILMLGLDNAGKTTIVKFINGEDVFEVSPTLGFNISTIEYKNFKLNIWDIGGQKSIRSYWRNYFEQTEALIWVVDSADKSRLDDCRSQLHALLVEERLAGASLMVLANKQDIHSSFSAEEISSFLELNTIKSHHWYVLGCSAASQKMDASNLSNPNKKKLFEENILKGIDWVVNDVTSRIYLAD